MKTILFFIVLCTLIAFPKGKYYIYFKDKGVKEGQLDKTSWQYSEALRNLSERAIIRRKKVLGNDFIQFEDFPLSRTYVQNISSLGIKVENELKWFNAVTAYLEDEQVNAIRKLPFVKDVVPIRSFYYKNDNVESVNSLNKKSDFNYGYSYEQLHIVQIPEVHAKGITGQGILIGFLDTGFDWKHHEALKNARVLNEYDFVKHDSITANQPGDSPGQDSHGTCTFSTVAGYKDSVLIGAAFGASFILSKTEEIATETHVEEDNYAAALEWMESQGVDITTSSLGYNIFDEGYSYTYKDMNGNTAIVTKAAKHAFSLGVVTITSAGNEGCENPSQCWYYIVAPADENNILSVGAVDANNEVTSYSSRGPTYDGRIKPDIVALGNSVFCVTSGTVDQYERETGTSLAAPIACGTAGLLLSAFPYLTNVQVRQIILMSADNYANPNNLRGYGLVSAKNAINMPNIKYDTASAKYLVNKFLFPEKIVLSSVKMIIISTSDTVTISMNNVNSFRFSAALPVFHYNEKVSISFTYADSAGTNYREPSAPTAYYSYHYGSDVITPSGINTVPPADYGILSNNYPNPFNNKTQFKFLSAAGERADILIYNTLGERIKTFTISNTINGYNTVEWDGRNDTGFTTSSGVYVYQLILNGSVYTKKMIMLR